MNQITFKSVQRFEKMKLCSLKSLRNFHTKCEAISSSGLRQEVKKVKKFRTTMKLTTDYGECD